MGTKADSRLVVTSVVLERQQLARLDAVAGRERRSRSFLVRDAIDRELQRHQVDLQDGHDDGVH